MAGVKRGAAVMTLACAVALAVTGCLPVIGPPTAAPEKFPRDEYGVVSSGVDPTARSYDDGVEVWDLSVPPTAEAFGIEVEETPSRGPSVAAYSATSVGGRPVRLLLPDGRRVQVTAFEVIFDLTDNTEAITAADGEVIVPEGRLFTLHVDVRSGEGPTKGREAYRDVLEQLDLPLTSLSELDAKIADAPNADPIEDPSEVGVGETVFEGGGLSVGVGTRFSPTSDIKVFSLRLSALWDAVPIPKE